MNHPSDQEYDAIADAYQSSKKLSFRQSVEEYTLFRILGDPTGLSAVDLACGEGTYTRKLKAAGVSEILGVDISGEMIQLTEAQEREQPMGCRYLRADAAEVSIGSPVDVAVGMFLLNYASTAEQLDGFCQSVCRMLKPGGRFVGFNDNVHEDANEAGSFAKYGFEKECSSPLEEGAPIV